MSNALTKTEITPEQIQTLAKAGVIPHDTPAAILQVFAHACKEHNVSPFKKEIYLLRYNTKQGSQYHTIVGIDGFRIKAARTGQYAGFDDPKYNMQSDGSFETAAMVKTSGNLPVSCTVTVYRLVGGQRCPFTSTVIFSEYYPAVKVGGGGYSKSDTMPFNMIAKCAEAKALKMAFSDELSGLHIEEEAAAFEDVTIEAAKKNPAAEIDQEKLKTRISECGTIEDLALLYNANPAHADFAEMFTDRKFELEPDLMRRKKPAK